jgi:hypothetical protein
MFVALKNWWAKLISRRREAKERKAEISRTMEAIIDMAGLNVRSVSSYAKKLRPALCAALEHVKELEVAIPGVLDISPRTWKHDPEVNALFVTQDELAPLFSQRGEAKAYFKASPPDQAFALLTMDREDRTVLTRDQQGSIARRDIPRTSVTFKNHRLIAISPSEDETRAGIRTRCLQVLADLAKEQVTQVKNRELELKELENLYKVRLSMIETKARGADLASDQSQEIKMETADLRRVLEEVRGELRQSYSSVEGHLLALQKALSTAPELLKAKEQRVLLNEFSMIAKADSGEKTHHLTLARITIGEEFRREAVLVRFKQSDF